MFKKLGLTTFICISTINLVKTLNVKSFWPNYLRFDHTPESMHAQADETIK